MSRGPIMIMAGGTGGHVYPALAIADALDTLSQPVIWLGTRRGLEARVIGARNIPIEWLSVSGLRGKNVFSWLLAPFRLCWALGQALRVMRRIRPRLVIGMGGFVSGPGGVAAYLTGTPLVIHEQNAIAGLTNRILARYANGVLQGFDGAFRAERSALTVGNPVRESIRDVAPPEARFATRSGPLRLLVIGGSQGALALNRSVPEALALIPATERPQIRHQAGATTLEAAQDAYSNAGVLAEVTPFIDDMATALAWADLAVCRAGALTVAELINVGLAAIFVPFPSAVDDHQIANAQALVDAGAALLVAQSELTGQRLADEIVALGSDRDTLLARAVRARALRQGDAVQRVIAECAVLLDDDSLAGSAS